MDVTEDPSRTAGIDRAPGHRPVIGISSYVEQVRWGTWDAPAMLLPRGYADAVAAAGANPVLLPPLPGIEQVVTRLDGLILSGGGDIDPAEFGAETAPETRAIRPARDAAEFALVSAALEHGLPLLGICRGLQVLNVALGGTLHQHLPALVGHDEHSPAPGGYGSHPVRVAAGSRLAGILAGDLAAIPVPTHHHQGIDRLGEGLTATAWTDDGVIEAVELAAPPGNGHPRTAAGGDGDRWGGRNGRGDGWFALAVQWHPEAGTDPRLFRALAGAAAGFAAARP